MMEQYFKVKAQHPDALIFYRMGEFYEMFGQDAVTGAKLLDIALTSRDRNKENAVPMCGVPFHSWQNYADRLTKAGHKVVLCEQMEDPKLAKGLVKREVVRVITPGTQLSENLLQEKQPQYLAAWICQGEAMALSLADLTTGEWEYAQGGVKELLEMMQRYRPVEVIHPDEGTAAAYAEQLKLITGGIYKKPHLQGVAPADFDPERARKILLQHFGTRSLDAYGLEHKPLAAAAAGGLLAYLQQTQHDLLCHLTNLKEAPRQGLMQLDEATIRNLELFEPLQTSLEDHSLIRFLDHTHTPMGGRMLLKWLQNPLTSKTKLEERQNCVQGLLNQPHQTQDLRLELKAVNDLERITAKIAMPVGGLSDLVKLQRGLAPLESLRENLGKLQDTHLQSAFADFDPLTDLKDLLTANLDDNPNLKPGEGGFIRPGVSTELDQKRDLLKNGKQHLSNLAEKEKQATGINSLKISYNKVFGYYLEVSNANRHLVPDYFIRKQTIANGERYITPDLKDLEEDILSAQEDAIALEQVILTRLLAAVRQGIPQIQSTARRIALLDVYASLAHLAQAGNYCRPQLQDQAPYNLEIIRGRHPVIEGLFPDDPFVPNNCALSQEGAYISVITGPNMGGKSTYMRQAALICLLAQIGSYVPAASAQLPIFDRIFTRVGAADNLAKGQSTFMVEMNEAAAILAGATEKSLVILDEIGRGTSTFDGISLAWAILEYLHKTRCLTLFATHYHELILLEDELSGVKNERVELDEAGDKIVFLRKVARGRAEKSYGIQVASLAGLPFEVILRAKQLLAELERAEEGLKHKRRERLSQAANQQITFAPLEAPWIEELRQFDLNRSTPLQAMEFLFHLKEQVR